MKMYNLEGFAELWSKAVSCICISVLSQKPNAQKPRKWPILAFFGVNLFIKTVYQQVKPKKESLFLRMQALFYSPIAFINSSTYCSPTGMTASPMWIFRLRTD